MVSFPSHRKIDMRRFNGFLRDSDFESLLAIETSNYNSYHVHTAAPSFVVSVSISWEQITLSASSACVPNQ
jgi:hypothetical protein